MAKNLRPIQLPIDPAKAHLYVARNGVRVSHIFDDKSEKPYLVTYINCHEAWLHRNGKRNKSECSDNQDDLTHEIIPEPEAQGLDWSGVIKGLALISKKYMRKTHGDVYWYDSDGFAEESITILKQFERKSIQTTHISISHEDQSIQTEQNCEGYKTEINILIEQILAGDNDKLLEYVRNNFPEQYAKQNIHIYTTEEIFQELNTWQDEPINPKHFCIRGQMIRQLMAEIEELHSK